MHVNKTNIIFMDNKYETWMKYEYDTEIDHGMGYTGLTNARCLPRLAYAASFVQGVGAEVS